MPETTPTTRPYDPEARARFVESCCIDPVRLLARPRKMKEVKPDEEQDFPKEQTMSFIDVIDYVAKTPVFYRRGDKMVQLSPGEAAYKIMSDPECEVTILYSRTKPENEEAGASP